MLLSGGICRPLQTVIALLAMVIEVGENLGGGVLPWVVDANIKGC